ncbi:M14 family metallocarboxypeptidase [Thalassotalea maritima]|uniref:M14 family metallopeptidase n=1 Tax=Thalassotalea maritima TaxID=3242416 RepID=UPI003526E7F0
MSQVRQYDIGTPGQKWQDNERQQWLARQIIKRSYQQDVVSQVQALADKFTVEQYGELNYQAGNYPLLALISQDIDINKPWVLVTGGVHGYETSGVHGALRFAQTSAEEYQAFFNFLILPCISPWGYETINRWNQHAIDPNRSFYADSPATESAAAMALVDKLEIEFVMHIDLHETTDTDNSEFRPALAARDGIFQTNWNIPDGFYLVGDSSSPQAEFQQAVITAVKQVTHIAPADDNGQLIGVDLAQLGVVNYDARPLGLCMGMTDATYKTTTEVYPDSPKVDDENCIVAQVAAITGGLDFLLRR